MELKINSIQRDGTFLVMHVDDSYQHIASKLKEGTPFVKEALVKIQDWYKSHTDAQRALFHKWLDVYYKSGFPSDETKHDLKLRLKHNANGTIYVKYYKYEFIECGEDDSEYNILKSTSKYNSFEYNNLIDALIEDMRRSGAGEILDNLIYEHQALKKSVDK